MNLYEVTAVAAQLCRRCIGRGIQPRRRLRSRTSGGQDAAAQLPADDLVDDRSCARCLLADPGSTSSTVSRYVQYNGGRGQRAAQCGSSTLMHGLSHSPFGSAGMRPHQRCYGAAQLATMLTGFMVGPVANAGLDITYPGPGPAAGDDNRPAHRQGGGFK